MSLQRRRAAAAPLLVVAPLLLLLAPGLAQLGMPADADVDIVTTTAEFAAAVNVRSQSVCCWSFQRYSQAVVHLITTSGVWQRPPLLQSAIAHAPALQLRAACGLSACPV